MEDDRRAPQESRHNFSVYSCEQEGKQSLIQQMTVVCVSCYKMQIGTCIPLTHTLSSV